jgi:hypothetical protein
MNNLNRVISGGLFALFVVLICEALTLFGVISVFAGHIVVLSAWLVGSFMVATEVIPGKKVTHKGVSILCLGMVLLALDLWALHVKPGPDAEGAKNQKSIQTAVLAQNPIPEPKHDGDQKGSNPITPTADKAKKPAEKMKQPSTKGNHRLDGTKNDMPAGNNNVQQTAGDNSTQINGDRNVVGNGNIVGSTVNMVPPNLNPSDPYAGTSNQEVAGMALSEADKIESRSQQCVNDVIALSENRRTSSPEYATPDAVRFFFTLEIQSCCVGPVKKLHDSMLSRLPSLMDSKMELLYELQLRDTNSNRGTCWDTLDRSIPIYLRTMANGLLAYKPPK